MAKVTTICYGERKEWKSRKSAIEFFFKGMNVSDGCEAERYMRIYRGLVAGADIATDGEPERKPRTPARKPTKNDIKKRKELIEAQRFAGDMLDAQRKEIAERREAFEKSILDLRIIEAELREKWSACTNELTELERCVNF